MTPMEEHLRKFYTILGKKERRTKDRDGLKCTEHLYLCKWKDNGCYLIIGGGFYEYAELSMSLFNDKKAKQIFELI